MILILYFFVVGTVKHITFLLFNLNDRNGLLFFSKNKKTGGSSF